MTGLLTPTGLRVLLARRFDSLRCGRNDQCANGDLANLAGLGRFQTALSKRPEFDEDTAVKVHLGPRQAYGHSYLEVLIDADKYNFSVFHCHPDQDQDEEQEEEDYEISKFLVEKDNNRWVLCEDFDKATSADKGFRSVLTGMHFAQLLRRCSRCNFLMSTPYQLCMQCDCQAVSVQDSYFCSVCQEHSKEGDVLVLLPCNHHLHAQCFRKLDRCPVCRKGCRGCGVETVVCRASV